MPITSSVFASAVSFALVSLTLPAAVAVPVAPQSGPVACPASWVPTYGPVPGLGGTVHALAEYDDGTGPALYASGSFRTAGGQPAERVAKWDGTSWSPLGLGLASTDGSPAATDLAVFDDGAGPALYAAGNFGLAGGQPAAGVARWDGTAWSSAGFPAGTAHSLAVHDDGAGPALYAGSWRLRAGVWQLLAVINDTVMDFCTFDDGSGPALYAGGFFTAIAGTPMSFAARWNGTAWVAANAGLTSPVQKLVVFDDGSGPALFAANGSGLVRWDGTSWTAIPGGGFAGARGLGVHDDGSGPAIYVGLAFEEHPGPPQSAVRRWNGSTWSTPGGFVRGIPASFLTHDDGSGPALFVAGSLTNVAGTSVAEIAKWDGSTWSGLGPGGGIDGGVRALAAIDDAAGPGFGAAIDVLVPGETAGRVARWDGFGWSNLGGTFTGLVEALAVADLGAGPEFYAGGTFTSVGGQASNAVARWDGSAWLPLGQGITNVGTTQTPSVRALLAFDDGTGPALYAAGCFNRAGLVAANRVAKWDGTTWAALGTGLENCGLALAVFDAGDGPRLHVGGTFTSASGSVVNRIARWNGSSWSALASGITAGTSAISVRSLVALDDGTGPALYVGGSFSHANGVPAANVARWNGSSWSALGSGVQGVNSATLTALASYDDGAGPRLFVGGDLITAGSMAASNVARWDPSTGWSALGSGLSHTLRALAAFDDGSGNGAGLIAGGVFASAFDSGDGYVARWQACPLADVAPFCAGDGSGSVCPCGNAGGERRGCANSSFPEGARLSASGRAHATGDTLVLRGTQMPDSSALYFQGTAQVNGGAGAVFGDGLRCAGGAVIRLGVAFNAGGTSTYPEPGDAPVSVRGACAPGDVRTYQVWYRNSASFCTAATFNLTNGLSATWGP